MPYYSPEDFAELIEYANMKNMCMNPGCTTCGCMPFRKLCRETIGYENICGIVRAVTPEYFAEHYESSWMDAAAVLNAEFYREGGLPDCCLLQKLGEKRQEKRILSSLVFLL